MVNHWADAVGGVDDDGEDGDATAELPEGVAVGFVVAVVAADAAQAVAPAARAARRAQMSS